MKYHYRFLFVVPLAVLGSQVTQARIRTILQEESEMFEIPRSQIKTYIQKRDLKSNLQSIRPMKPGALSDDELMKVPEKYLTPELRSRQKTLRSQQRGSGFARVLPKKQDVVSIAARNKNVQVRIDQAVWVPSQKGEDSTVLAPQKRLPEVELLQEQKFEGSSRIAVELKPGDPREIFQVFESGKTRNPSRTPLLPAFYAYRKGDYATAATLALAQMTPNVPADTRVTARYLLAHALYQSGFYASASPLLVDLVDSRWRRSAVGLLANLLEKTRDDGTANQVMTKVSLSQIPEEQQPLFSFHLGRILLNSGAGSAALAAFDRVPPLHRRYPEAQYYMGVIKASQLGSNIRDDEWEKEGGPVHETRTHFEQAVLGGRTDRAEDLRNLASLSLARLAYQSKQYNQSVYYYDSVKTASPFAREAIFESAWSLYRLGEFNRSLGTLHPLGSKYFEGRDFAELWILRSLNYLKLCRFDESRKAANTFEALVRGLFPELRQASQTIRSASFNNPRDIENTSLPGWLKSVLLTDPVIQKDLSEEQLLRDEKARLHVLRKNENVKGLETRAQAADALGDQIDNKMRAVAKALKPYIQGRIDDMISEYAAQRERLDLLRFEIYSQANRFPIALERPEAKKLLAKSEFLPGVFLQGHEILWRFTGESWFDELRGYDYFIPTECRAD